MSHVWPQVTYLVLVCMGAGVTLAKFGERKVTTHNWADLVSTGLVLALLYYGGFFTPLGF